VWTYNAANKRIEIEIAQTQKGMAYRLPLEIGVAEGIVRIEMTEKQQHFEIPVEREPAVVTLDPNTWVLMEARFGKR
jgi:hypothetical protein